MSETLKQIENINKETKDQTEFLIETILKEYDWLTKDKQYICDNLKENQEKLRPLEDIYKTLLENHKKESNEAIEVKHKIGVLQAKLKQLYELYKK